MVFLNTTETIGMIINAGTQSTTGNIFATLLMILIFLIVIGMMFGIPLEFIALIILPICLGCGAYFNNFLVPVIVIIIYFAILIVKHWIFR